MIADLLAPKLLLIYYCIAAALYTHHRGRVRHRPFRQLSDHSTFMAPVNAIMYLFCKVPCTPYINTSHFPELKILNNNWEVIPKTVELPRDIPNIKAAMFAMLLPGSR